MVELSRHLTAGSNVVHPEDAHGVKKILQSIQSLAQAAINHNYLKRFSASRILALVTA